MLIYNFLEYSLNYSDRTGSFQLYFKDRVTNFNTDNANTDDFNSFKNKTKSERITDANEANGILRSTVIVVPLKYLGNFWISIKITLINSKVALKHKWTNYCALSTAAVDNDDANPNIIIFTIK